MTMSNFDHVMVSHLGQINIKGTRASKLIWNHLQLMFAAYVSHGFKLVGFSTDTEGGFESNRVNIETYREGVKYVVAEKDEKVKQLERKIRSIKEVDRTTRLVFRFVCSVHYLCSVCLLLRDY